MSEKWKNLLLVFATGLGSALTAPSLHALDSENTKVDGVEYLMVSGSFNEDANRESVKLTAKFTSVLRSGNTIAMLVTSEGGSRETALRMARTVNAMARSHYNKLRRPLVVGMVGQCHSACTFFAAELTKSHDPKKLMIVVPSDTEFQFHGPLNAENGKPLPARDFEFHLANGLAQYRESGVNPQWLEKNRRVFRVTVGKIFTAHKLCVDQTMIIPPDSCVRTYEDMEKKILDIRDGKLSRNPLLKLFGFFLGGY